jgi:hypothetical protein
MNTKPTDFDKQYLIQVILDIDNMFLDIYQRNTYASLAKYSIYSLYIIAIDRIYIYSAMQYKWLLPLLRTHTYEL